MTMQKTQEMRVQSLVRNISWSRKWQPTPVFLLGESHGQWSLVGYLQSMGPKESNTTEGLSMKDAKLF